MFCRTPPLLPPFCNEEKRKSNEEFELVPDASEDIPSLEFSVTDFGFFVTEPDFSVTEPGFCVTIRISNCCPRQGFGRRAWRSGGLYRILRVSKCRSAPRRTGITARPRDPHPRRGAPRCADNSSLESSAGTNEWLWHPLPASAGSPGDRSRRGQKTQQIEGNRRPNVTSLEIWRHRHHEARSKP
jgi:hypothetical protein